MKVLLYPQFVLAFWGPLLVFGVWHLLRFWRPTLPVQVHFWLAWAVMAFPLLALFVPYLPNLVVRKLPYRAPIAWGILTTPDLTTASPGYVLTLCLPFLLTFGGLLVAFVFSITEELAARYRIARVPSARAGRVRVLYLEGDAAFTLGLLCPRVYLSERLWVGPHREAILAHELAHANAYHPLFLAAARLVARTWWYVPWVWPALRDLELAAERCADEASVRAVGKVRLVGALLGAQHAAPTPGLAFGSATSVMKARAEHLRRGATPLSRRSLGWFLGVLVPLYLVLLILL